MSFKAGGGVLDGGGLSGDSCEVRGWSGDSCCEVRRWLCLGVGDSLSCWLVRLPLLLTSDSCSGSELFIARDSKTSSADMGGSAGC